MSDGESRIAEIEETYGVTLPKRYAEFLASGSYENYRILEMKEGYLNGSFELDFLASELVDLAEMGDRFDIDDLMSSGDLDWSEEFPDLLPFATLVDVGDDDEDEEEEAEEDDDEERVRGFLVIDASDDRCPVSLWDSDGWDVYRLADSLDDFLAGKAARKSDARFNLSN